MSVWISRHEPVCATSNKHSWSWARTSFRNEHPVLSCFPRLINMSYLCHSEHEDFAFSFVLPCSDWSTSYHKIIYISYFIKVLVSVILLEFLYTCIIWKKSLAEIKTRIYIYNKCQYGPNTWANLFLYLQSARLYSAMIKHKDRQ